MIGRLALAAVVLAALAASVVAVAGVQRTGPGETDEAPLSVSTAPPPPTAGSPDASDGPIAVVDPAWVAAVSADTGIPARALRTYAGVAVSMSSSEPGCGLDWATLAGIGWVESQHGTVHDGRIEADGQQEPPLFGIPLDGRTTAHIPDSDDGRLDGDDSIDRAVGPMQFIPSTWRSHGADGNGDGVKDPQNLDDAVVAAGRYLCETGGDLTASDGWIAAIGAYNASIDYNHQVVAATNRYAGAG